MLSTETSRELSCGMLASTRVMAHSDGLFAKTPPSTYPFSEIVILFGLARRTARKSRKYHYFTGEAPVTASARRKASAVIQHRIRARAGGRDRRAKVEFIRQILQGRLRGRGGAGAALDRFELDRVEDEMIARTATAATAERGPLHGFGVKG